MDYLAIDERNETLADEHDQGATFAELASKYGISRQRCKQIYDVVAKSRERSEDQLFVKVKRAAALVGTPHVGRAYNAARRYAFDENDTTWDDLIGYRNIGVVTAAVIAEAFGIDIPEDTLDMLMLRGYCLHRK